MPEPVPAPRRALVLSDGAAGNENQALALAHALAAEADIVRLQPRWPWRAVAPRLLPAAEHAFGAPFIRHLRAPWPDLAIGCGRQAALATRLIHRASTGACRSVQILDPRIDPRHFDLVIAPRHDGLHGRNVVTTLGGLNAIDGVWLERARAAFPRFATLPAPCWTLLLGGPTRALQLDRAYWDGLVAILRPRLLQQGASLLVTSSRRTPDWLRAAARTDLADIPGMQWHGPQDGPNPYPGMLAHADAIVATPDSVNMLSEAAATDVPLWSHTPVPVRGKVGNFVAALHESGRLRLLGEPDFTVPIFPLRETARVAEEIRARWGWHQGTFE